MVELYSKVAFTESACFISLVIQAGLVANKISNKFGENSQTLCQTKFSYKYLVPHGN